MSRKPGGRILCGFTMIYAVLGFVRETVATNASLCLTEPTGCDFPGSTVDVEVRLGEGDAAIVGAQFTLDFDPQALKVFDIFPGSTCDAQSPFSLEIHQEIDDSSGTLFYAVGINPFVGEVGTRGPTTVACIRFLPRGVSQSELCLMAGDDPQVTRLSDGTGHAVSISNLGDCPTNTPAGALSCRVSAVEAKCRCDHLGDDCATLNNACRTGVCDPDTLLCTVAPANEGGACDDHNECTTIDRCTDGRCIGSGCTNPSLCLTPDGCTPPGGLMTVPVRLGEGDPVIIGAQFSVRWNTAGLELVDVTPGNVCDPLWQYIFVNEVGRIVNSANGELFYAVGVASDRAGTSGPATLACLFFRVLDRNLAEVCGFDDINPFMTKLVDETGQFVDFFNESDCPSERGFPFLNCVQFEFCEIPAVSEWGLAILTLVLLVGAKVRFARAH